MKEKQILELKKRAKEILANILQRCTLWQHHIGGLAGIITKLIERGIVKTVKSAKKIVDRREPDC